MVGKGPGEGVFATIRDALDLVATGRRHSSLGMLTPIEFEARHLTPIPAA